MGRLVFDYAFNSLAIEDWLSGVREVVNGLLIAESGKVPDFTNAELMGCVIRFYESAEYGGLVARFDVSHLLAKMGGA